MKVSVVEQYKKNIDAIIEAAPLMLKQSMEENVEVTQGLKVNIDNKTHMFVVRSTPFGDVFVEGHGFITEGFEAPQDGKRTLPTLSDDLPEAISSRLRPTLPTATGEYEYGDDTLLEVLERNLNTDGADAMLSAVTDKEVFIQETAVHDLGSSLYLCERLSNDDDEIFRNIRKETARAFVKVFDYFKSDVFNMRLEIETEINRHWHVILKSEELPIGYELVGFCSVSQMHKKFKSQQENEPPSLKEYGVTKPKTVCLLLTTDEILFYERK